MSVKEIVRNAFSKSKSKQTSLVDSFYYPKLGAGQMWEKLKDEIESLGGKIILEGEVKKVHVSEGAVVSLEYKKLAHINEVKCDYCMSSMPIRELIGAIGKSVPRSVRAVSSGLVYRDIVNIYFELAGLKIKNNTKIATIRNIIPDNWIYIQDSQVKVGRLTIYNNMSPYLPVNRINILVGMEFYCYKGDQFWRKGDKEIIEFAKKELKKIGIIGGGEVIASHIFRQEKAYPAYFGSYGEFEVIRSYLDNIKNLYPIGRNGMHKYNNMDHSMLSAMEAVNCIINKKDKSKVWDVNAEKDYHEKK